MSRREPGSNSPPVDPAPPAHGAKPVELMAMLEISFSALARLLQLPDGCRIDGVFTSPDVPDVVAVRLRGAGWLVSPGDRVKKASAVCVITNDPGAVRIMYDFPQTGTP